MTDGEINYPPDKDPENDDILREDEFEDEQEIADGMDDEPSEDDLDTPPENDGDFEVDEKKLLD